jgi:ABC-type sugar transport system ATPase subunit
VQPAVQADEPAAPSRHEIGHVLDLIRGLKRQKTATIQISHR